MAKTLQDALRSEITRISKKTIKKENAPFQDRVADLKKSTPAKDATRFYGKAVDGLYTEKNCRRTERIYPRGKAASNALFGKKSQVLTFTPPYDTKRICPKDWR